MLEGSTCAWHYRPQLAPLDLYPAGSQTYYFQAKSLSKQRAGMTRPMSQTTGLGNNRGMTPRYSLEIPVIGATYAYSGRKIIHRIMDPGMATKVYLVQMFVIRAALPSTVASAAVYRAEPQTQ